MVSMKMSNYSRFWILQCGKSHLEAGLNHPYFLSTSHMRESSWPSSDGCLWRASRLKVWLFASVQNLQHSQFWVVSQNPSMHWLTHKTDEFCIFQRNHSIPEADPGFKKWEVRRNGPPKADSSGGGHAPPGNFEIQVLGNAISSVLRNDGGRFNTLTKHLFLKLIC